MLVPLMENRRSEGAGFTSPFSYLYVFSLKNYGNAELDFGRSRRDRINLSNISEVVLGDCKRVCEGTWSRTDLRYVNI